MKHLVSFLLLTVGTALATAGLALWQDRAYDFAGLWTFADGPHPLLLIAVGLAIIPSALWEIFLLEMRHNDE